MQFSQTFKKRIKKKAIQILIIVNKYFCRFSTENKIERKDQIEDRKRKKGKKGEKDRKKRIN